MIRVDALWLSTTPLDMRAGTETILARVVSMWVFRAILGRIRQPRRDDAKVRRR